MIGGFVTFVLLHLSQASLSNMAVVFSPDDLCDLKAGSSPTMDNEITAKERGLLENNEKEEMDQERAEEGDERKMKEEGDDGEEKTRKDQEPLTEEQELEELRAQVLQLLLELEDARETSNKHQESFHELQGQRSSFTPPPSDESPGLSSPPPISQKTFNAEDYVTQAEHVWALKMTWKWQ